MVQREVGERFAAPPCTRTYGATSVLAQLACEVRVHRRVPRSAFSPAPNVDSTIVVLRRRRPTPSRPVRDVVRAAFAHRRKTLAGSLELADRVEVEPLAEGREDRIRCPGVEGPNLAAAALAAYREVRPSDGPPALEVRIDKRVPVAGGLGGREPDLAAEILAARPQILGPPL